MQARQACRRQQPNYTACGMWVLYQLALTLFIVVSGPFLLATKGRHYLATLRGRLGSYGRSSSRRPLWIHAVSVGEVEVASTLAQRLPDLPLLVTTITPTGQARARRLLGARATIAYLPFDLGLPVARFFRTFDPAALVLVEGDYWPLLLDRARGRGLPIAVINGRVGDTTARRFARWPRIAQWLTGAVDRFGLQSEADVARLARIGLSPHRLTVTGNIKFDSPAPPPLRELEAHLEALAGGRPILVAGSTMEGEEGQIIEAFEAAGGADAAMLLLAPRHPERWPAVAQRLDRTGVDFTRRSTTPESGRPAVVLLDSLGELADCYRFAAAAFVGGTLVPTGGHNPIEPARLGTPVAVGPSMENFRDMARIFERRCAWRRVNDATELGAVWREWLLDPSAAMAQGRRGQELVAENRGAVDRTLELLAPLLETMSEPRS